MFWGLVGTLLSVGGFLLLLFLLGDHLPNPVTVPCIITLVVICVPANMLYLWTHRSPDNSRFIPK